MPPCTLNRCTQCHALPAEPPPRTTSRGLQNPPVLLGRGKTHVICRPSRVRARARLWRAHVHPSRSLTQIQAARLVLADELPQTVHM